MQIDAFVTPFLLVATQILYIAGPAIMAFVSSWELLFFGRIIIGLGVSCLMQLLRDPKNYLCHSTISVRMRMGTIVCVCHQIGASAVVSPQYMGEMAPKEVRGALVSTYEVCTFMTCWQFLYISPT